MVRMLLRKPGIVDLVRDATWTHLHASENRLDPRLLHLRLVGIARAEYARARGSLGWAIFDPQW
jgi:hypothetical protein